MRRHYSKQSEELYNVFKSACSNEEFEQYCKQRKVSKDSLLNYHEKPHFDEYWGDDINRDTDFPLYMAVVSGQLNRVPKYLLEDLTLADWLSRVEEDPHFHPPTYTSLLKEAFSAGAQTQKLIPRRILLEARAQKELGLNADNLVLEGYE